MLEYAFPSVTVHDPFEARTAGFPRRHKLYGETTAMYLFDVTYLVEIPWPCIGLLIGITHGDDKAQLIAFGQAELLEIGLAIGMGI